MTFSLIARCAMTGQFGIVIASSSPAVAARCSHVRASFGVVASQNITDPALGPLILDRLESGQDAASALAGVLSGHKHRDYRQVLVLDRSGHSAVHSGRETLGVWAEATGTDCAAGGNLLAGKAVPAAMVGAFEATKGLLGDRLIVALKAGRDAGGEAGPVHSAGIKIADRLTWPFVDLRVDWVEQGCPVEALAEVWQIYRPQAPAYVQRALDPSAAPSFGVPGDR